MNEQICCKCHETLVNGLSDSLDHVGWWIDCGSEVTRVDPNIVPWPCGTRMKTSLDQASTNVSWSDGPKLLYISHDHVSAQNSAIRDPSRVLLWQLWWTLKSSNIWSSSERRKMVYGFEKWAHLSRDCVQFTEISDSYSVLGADKRWRGPFYLYLGVYATARCSVPTLGS